jgi:hypothetical protein
VDPHRQRINRLPCIICHGSLFAPDVSHLAHVPVCSHGIALSRARFERPPQGRWDETFAIIGSKIRVRMMPSHNSSVPASAYRSVPVLKLSMAICCARWHDTTHVLKAQYISHVSRLLINHINCTSPTLYPLPLRACISHRATFPRSHNFDSPRDVTCYAVIRCSCRSDVLCLYIKVPALTARAEKRRDLCALLITQFFHSLAAVKEGVCLNHA